MYDKFLIFLFCLKRTTRNRFDILVFELIEEGSAGSLDLGRNLHIIYSTYMSAGLSNVWCSLLAKHPSRIFENNIEKPEPQNFSAKWNFEEDLSPGQLPPHYVQIMSLAGKRAQTVRFLLKEREVDQALEQAQEPPDALSLGWESGTWSGISILRIQGMTVDLPTTRDPKHLLLLLLRTVSHSNADSQRKFVSSF